MITTFSWFGYTLPMYKNFKMIKRSGFDGVMLWWDDAFGDTDYRSNPELAREAGLYVENIHAPFKRINDIWLDNIEGNELAEYYSQLVTECASYEIPTMVMHPSSGNNVPPYNLIGLDRVRRIIDTAEKYNINVAFENMRKYEYLKYILDHIDSPRAGFCYDAGHHHYWQPNCNLLAQYGSRLMALHLHDNDRIHDQHLLPFDGTIDWNTTMYQICQCGYKGAIALEAENEGYQNLPPEIFLRLAYERGKKLEHLADNPVQEREV